MGFEPHGRLHVGKGGWVLFEGRDFATPTYARFVAAAGRLELSELYLAGENRLTPATIRQLPVVMLEGLANLPGTREAIMAKLLEPGADLRRLAANFDTTYPRQATHWVARSYEAQIKGSREPESPMPRRKPRTPERMPMPPIKIEIPSAASYGDAFYLAVANAYAFLALSSRRPAVELADANGVPATTTRRWIKEARRRGFLPPGQKGRRG